MSVLKLVKLSGDIPLDLEGVSIDLQIVDGKTEAVTITDKKGDFIRIVKEGTYTDNLKILVQEPKIYKSVYKLTINHEGGVLTFENLSESTLHNKISAYGENNVIEVKESQVEDDGVTESFLEPLPF